MVFANGEPKTESDCHRSRMEPANYSVRALFTYAWTAVCAAARISYPTGLTAKGDLLRRRDRRPDCAVLNALSGNGVADKLNEEAEINR